MKRLALLLSIILILCGFILSVSVAENGPTGTFLSGDERIAIYEAPESAQIGWYYSGIAVTVIDESAPGWVLIQTGPDGKSNGYVCKDQITNIENTGNTPVFSTDSYNWKLYTLPDLQSAYSVQGKEQNIRLLGIFRGWWHIQLKDSSGFVQAGASFLHLVKGMYYDGYEYCVVNNTDPKDRLHLRKEPSSGSQSLGKYYNGVKAVLLSEEKNGWAHVRIGNLEGYMLAVYLSRNASIASATPVINIQNSSGQGLHLRTLQSTESKSQGLYKNGQSVTVLGISGTWCHVFVDGKTGFMLASGFDNKISYHISSAGSPSKQIQKSVINQDCSLYNTCTHPTEDNIMTTLTPGDSVTVLSIDDQWAMVKTAHGKTGYVHRIVLDSPSDFAEQTVTINQNCSLYNTNASPTEDNIMTTLTPGDSVTILSMDDQWAKVKTAHGKTGYVHKIVLELN